MTADLKRRIGALDAVVFDFDGVFTDNTVTVDANGVESVRCWRSDGLGLAKLSAMGVKVLIFSTEMNPVVSVRARKLRTACVQGIEDKGAALADWSHSTGLDLSRVAFVGNDINDIPAFRAVGLPIAVADAHADVMPFVKFRTRTPGGFGAVREVCDLVVACKARGTLR